MKDSYWAKSTAARLNRRRMLSYGLGAAAGLGALSILGCGDDDDGGGATTGTTTGSTVTTGVTTGPGASTGGGAATGSTGPVEDRLTFFTSDSEEGPAKRGGTWLWAYGAEPATLDPYAQTASSVYAVLYGVMSKLVKQAIGPGHDPEDFDVGGDLATSWEQSSDLLTYTFKLNPEMKFHNVEPVNGRPVDSEDMRYSWMRLQEHAFYGTFFGSTTPEISTPDANTVVFNLASPDVAFMAALIERRATMVMPRESESGYDARDKAIGSGPWILRERVPSSNIEYERNPEFPDGTPYMDAMSGKLISEDAVLLAQFQSRNLPTVSPGDPANLAPLLEANRDVRIVPGLTAFPGSGGVTFQRMDPDGPSAFIQDKRNRQALSMMIDRAAIFEAFVGVDTWAKLGIEVPVRLDNFVAAAFKKYWIDPAGDEMGDSSRYFIYDVEEARKLLDAAGYPFDYEPDFHFAASFQSEAYRTCATVVAEMLNEGGIRAKPYADDYNLEYQAKSQIGENTGLSFTNLSSGSSDASGNLDELFAPTGRRNQMKVDDPIYNELAAMARVTTDEDERRAVFVELQRYLGEEMRWSPVSFAGIPYRVFWPYVKNVGAYRGGTHYTEESNFWLDE
jgi:peptide/nickel transport system substrate-binding protein